MKDEVLESKLDNINSDLLEIKLAVGKSSSSSEHQNKTIEEMNQRVKKVEEDLLPINKHMIIMSSLVKGIGGLGAVIGLLLGIIELIAKTK